MNQIKICLWECTQQQLRCYAPKRTRRRCDETTITGCTGSYHFDNLQCGQWRKSKKLSLLCMSDMETRSRRITPCQCSLLRLLLRPSGPQSVIKGLPQHPRHRITDFFALSCCYKYSNRFHHSRNNINQSSSIWCGGKQSINYAS